MRRGRSKAAVLGPYASPSEEGKVCPFTYPWLNIRRWSLATHPTSQFDLMRGAWDATVWPEKKKGKKEQEEKKKKTVEKRLHAQVIQLSRWTDR